MGGAPAFQAPESVCDRYRRSSDVWSFGIIVSLFYGAKFEGVKEESEEVKRDVKSFVSEEDEQTQSNIQYWMSRNDIIPTLVRRRRCLAATQGKTFEGIVAKCLQVEGTTANTRGSFSDLIIELEHLRVANNWPWRGDFPEIEQYFK